MNNEITIRSKNAAKALTDFVNYGHSKKEFAKALMKEHRYLQSEVFELMIFCMEEWKICLDKGDFDGRNEHVCVTSKRILEIL